MGVHRGQWRATKGYVEDVAAAIVAAAGADRAIGRIYSAGEADTLTELEWAEQIARALNWNGEFKLMPNDDLPAHLRAPGNTAQHWIAIRRGFVSGNEPTHLLVSRWTSSTIPPRTKP